MAKINTYGLKMHGLRKAAGSTKTLTPYDGNRDQICYDTATGDVLSAYHTQNSW